MGYTFNCRFCKNQKNITERTKILLWNPSEFDEIYGSNICKNCFFKLFRILQSKTINSEMNSTLETWGFGK